MSDLREFAPVETSTSGHSPLPWRLGDAGPHEPTAHDIYANDGDHVCTNRADAEFICLCVNSHQQLIDALRNLLDTLNEDLSPEACAAWDRAYEVLAAAEGSK